MIFKPPKEPFRVFVMISFIVVLGIILGLFVDAYFIAAALLFWMYYTAVLSYFQFKRGSKHSYDNIIEYLLHPQIRFFLFEFIAILGIVGVFRDFIWAGVGALLAWWLFALNFYRYYSDFKKYE